jgi:hypothetical protein
VNTLWTNYCIKEINFKTLLFVDDQVVVAQLEDELQETSFKLNEITK